MFNTQAIQYMCRVITILLLAEVRSGNVIQDTTTTDHCTVEYTVQLTGPYHWARCALSQLFNMKICDVSPIRSLAFSLFENCLSADQSMKVWYHIFVCTFRQACLSTVLKWWSIESLKFSSYIYRAKCSITTTLQNEDYTRKFKIPMNLLFCI